MLQFIKNILPSQSPLLPDQVWAAIRTEHYRLRIEEAYIYWIQGLGYSNVTSISPDLNSNYYFRISRQNKLSHPLKKYIFYHQKCHPIEKGKTEVQQFLKSSGDKRKISTLRYYDWKIEL